MHVKKSSNSKRDDKYFDAKKEMHRVTSDDPDKQKTCYSHDTIQKLMDAANAAGLGAEFRELENKIHAATSRKNEVGSYAAVKTNGDSWTQSPHLPDEQYDEIKKDIHRATSDKPEHQKMSPSKDDVNKLMDAAKAAGLKDEAHEMKTKVHAATQLHRDRDKKGQQ